MRVYLPSQEKGHFVILLFRYIVFEDNHCNADVLSLSHLTASNPKRENTANWFTDLASVLQSTNLYLGRESGSVGARIFLLEEFWDGETKCDWTQMGEPQWDNMSQGVSTTNNELSDSPWFIGGISPVSFSLEVFELKLCKNCAN